MNLSWITPADRIKKLPPYVFARLDELKAKAIKIKYNCSESSLM